MLGCATLSTATSANERCTALSKAESEGTVISTALKNPKKQAVAGAHSMRSSELPVLASHIVLNF